MEQNSLLFQPRHARRQESTAGSVPTGRVRTTRPQRPPAPSASRSRQRVKVPMRLVESPFYGDASLSVYVKIKALGLRPEACTAGIATLASYLHLSESTVERGIAQLRAEAPDGVVELPQNRRRSLPGGRGTTARRQVRPLQAHERFVWIPVSASECLRPRLLRAYAVITYAVVRRIPLTEGELAGYLRHHSGSRAGRPVSVDAAGRIIDKLTETGWITVDRRAGFRGRHRFVVHDGRGEASAPPGGPTPRPDDGSGSRTGAASLAYKEDLRTDRPDDDGASLPSAVGETQVGGGAVRPAGAPPRAAGRDGLPPRPSGGGRPPYTGPRLTFSARVDAVLGPVRPMLSGAGTYLQRLVGREVGRQLDDGADADRLRARLTTRLALTPPGSVRDPGRWLLGVALPRWGCGDPDCESGTLWSTQTRCRACAEAAADRRRSRCGASAPGGRASPSGRTPVCCPQCERPHLPGGSGVCRDCRSGAPTGGPSPGVPAGVCRGGTGQGCGRTAPSGLCWRCRTVAVSAGRRPARGAGAPRGGDGPAGPRSGARPRYGVPGRGG